MKQNLTISFLVFLLPITGFPQIKGFSLATDFNIIRNFKNQQHFWAIGHNTNMQFHITNSDAVYIGFIYTSNGKFNNSLQATAKSSTTMPHEINYVNKGKMRSKEFSIGWKKYLKGKFDVVKGVNIYGTAGFGLLLGRIINTNSVVIDTANYDVPVKIGKANFKRLTFDLGLGAEVPLGADFYFYMEAKAWIPTTDYPSQYLFVNNNAPFVGVLCGGIRIVF